MRLLVVTNDFPPNAGGIENYIYSLVRRWPPDDVTVVTRQMPGDEDFDAGQRFEIRREPVSTLLPTPGLSRRLARLAQERRIDIVHFPSALPLGILGGGLGLPYAVSVHGGEFLLASRIPGIRLLLRTVCREAAMLLPESSFAESLVRRFMGSRSPMTRVTCGVDPERYGPAARPVKLQARGPVIVSVSRLVPRKGARTLVTALPFVLQANPDAHLAIVGGGPDSAHVARMVAEAGLEDSVTMAGPQPWEEVPSYLAAAEIFALPTRNRFLGTETEGLPLVFVEAAAAGLPLIGGDVGGVRDAVRPSETGILVDGGSAAQTARAILHLLNNPDEARRMGANARRMVLQEFTWDELYPVYRKALERCAS